VTIAGPAASSGPPAQRTDPTTATTTQQATTPIVASPNARNYVASHVELASVIVIPPFNRFYNQTFSNAFDQEGPNPYSQWEQSLPL
jgi:pectin methylesterase-like acyl-CoA thioesterase